MVKYSLTIYPKNNQDRQGLTYILDLNTSQENNPATIFNLEIRESMKKSFENKGGYRITSKNLDYIINRWLEDICSGYRETSLSIKLPLLIDSQINQVIESGHYDIPDLFEPDLSIIEPKGGAFPLLNFPI